MFGEKTFQVSFKGVNYTVHNYSLATAIAWQYYIVVLGIADFDAIFNRYFAEIESFLYLCLRLSRILKEDAQRGT